MKPIGFIALAALAISLPPAHAEDTGASGNSPTTDVGPSTPNQTCDPEIDALIRAAKSVLAQCRAEASDVSEAQATTEAPGPETIGANPSSPPMTCQPGMTSCTIPPPRPAHVPDAAPGGVPWQPGVPVPPPPPGSPAVPPGACERGMPGCPGPAPMPSGTPKSIPAPPSPTGGGVTPGQRPISSTRWEDKADIKRRMDYWKRGFDDWRRSYGPKHRWYGYGPIHRGGRPKPDTAAETAAESEDAGLPPCKAEIEQLVSIGNRVIAHCEAEAKNPPSP
jgi:hypothetical protein